MVSSIASRWVPVLALPLVSWAQVVAAADVSPATTATATATAQALFDEARRLFDDGQIHQACEKFSASQKIEPRGGTLLDLALCHQREGKTATAWVEFLAARARARTEGMADREKFATDRIDALAPVLVRLRLDVGAGARAPGLSITLDGERVVDAAWGTGIPVDPGLHRVEASAPGRLTWRKNVEVGDHAEPPVVVIPPLASATVPLHAGSSDVVAADATSSGRRVAGWAVTGAGAAAVVVGSFFGVQAIGKSHDAQSACSGGTCGPTAQTLRQDGVRDAWISDFAIGGGLLAAAVGVYLVLSSAPSGTSSQGLRAMLTARGVVVSGSW
jgi:hypothetical protein